MIMETLMDLVVSVNISDIGLPHFQLSSDSETSDTSESASPSSDVTVDVSSSREPAGLIASRVIFALLVSGNSVHSVSFIRDGL